MDNDISPSSQGLLRCLQALAEEAACLGLLHTYVGLQETIRACTQETGMMVGSAPPDRIGAAIH